MPPEAAPSSGLAELADVENRSVVGALEAVIAERKARPVGSRSYVRSLLDGGLTAIGEKIVEEAAEVVEAASEPGAAGHDHLVRELADLVFHILVLMGQCEVDWSEIEAELARRFGISGIDEKASRAPE
jgi:phosphoribosyl-ATP pyrophosphohydrolase